MCHQCDRFKDRVGYKGQKYVVYYTRDGEESIMGWQNSPSGGLEKAAKLMPGVTSTRVDPVHREQYPWLCETCGARYAEYVNGCPKCWHNGEVRSGVRHDGTPELEKE